MLIALDYDGTANQDPETWFKVIDTFIEAGHSIVIVTMRYPSECEDIEKGFKDRCEILATSRMAKQPFVQELGYNVNVWIDDHPAAVLCDAVDIWGVSSPEGAIVTGNAQDVGS